MTLRIFLLYIVQVWDILDHNCLLTVRPKGHKIRGDLQACHYSSAAKSIAIATDQMAILNLKQKWVEFSGHFRLKWYRDLQGKVKTKLTNFFVFIYWEITVTINHFFLTHVSFYAMNLMFLW